MIPGAVFSRAGLRQMIHVVCETAVHVWMPALLSTRPARPPVALYGCAGHAAITCRLRLSHCD